MNAVYGGGGRGDGGYLRAFEADGGQEELCLDGLPRFEESQLWVSGCLQQ